MYDMGTVFCDADGTAPHGQVYHQAFTVPFSNTFSADANVSAVSGNGATVTFTPSADGKQWWP